MQRTSTSVPVIAATSLICEGARVVGDVQIGPFSSVWYNAVLRGDNGAIRIGECSNIQDNVVLHMSPGGQVTIGDFVTVGHLAMLHGCTIGNNCLIGMNAVLMNGVVIGANSIVAAGAKLKRRVYPPNSLIDNNEVVRPTTERDWERNRSNALEYKELTLRQLGLSSMPGHGAQVALLHAEQALAA